VQWHEQLRDTPARTQFGRALAELGIEWIAAQTPQAKGRIERLFGTLQDRLVKEMRLAGIRTLERANRFLEITFWPFWDKRFAVRPAQSGDAHRSLQPAQRLEQILSVRVGAHRGFRPHGELGGPALGRAAQRGVRGTAGRSGRDRAAARRHALAALSRPLRAAEPLPERAATGKSFRPTACRPCRSKTKTPNQEQNQIQSASRSPLEETLEADISIWQKTGHFYFALTRTSVPVSLQSENVRFVQSRNVRFSRGREAPWKRSGSS